MTTAISKSCSSVFRNWVDALSNHKPFNDDDNLEGFIELMPKHLICRDLLICSAMDPNLSVGDMLEMVDDPLGERTREYMNRILRDAEVNPVDRGRVVEALDAWGVVIELGEDIGLAAHPLAAKAYLEWAIGDFDAAMPLVAHALDIDDGCGLAITVLLAVGRGARLAGA